MKINSLQRAQLKKRILKAVQADIKREIEIISAVPLSADQQNEIKRALPHSEHADFRFTVDVNLIGGLIIRDGSHTLDMSLQSRIESVVTSLL